MKKVIFGLILGIFLSSGIVVAAEFKIVPNPFPVFIDGTKVSVEGYNIDGSTYLKLRDFEKAGLKIYFDEEKRQIEITTNKAETKAPTTNKGVSNVSNVSDVPLNKYGLPDFSEYEGTLPEIEVENGHRYFSYDGKRYIFLVNEDGGPLINRLQGGYKMYCVPIDGVISHQIIFVKEAPNGEETLIDEVPYARHRTDRDYCLEYDYYLNTILPMIK